MASGVTNLTKPQAYTPAFNIQNITASSTNNPQPNFKYTVKVTDVITSTVKTYQCAQFTDTTLRKNIESAAELFSANYLPINSYGWKKVTGALRQIKVNIGETYDIVGVPTYTAGSDQTYYIWNACLDFLPFQSYTYIDFVYNCTLSRPRYLTDLLNEKTFTDRSNLFYALTSQAGDLQTLKIDTYNAAGTPIGTSYIANPWEASVTYTDKYICIDVGIKGLTNIAAGAVTGTYPIITSNVAYYDVSDGSILGTAPPQFIYTLIKRYTVTCSPIYDVITLHCLMHNGNYRSIQCNMLSERKATISKTSYKKLPYYQATGGSAVIYDYNAAVENILNVITQDKLIVRTDWLSEAESLLYKQAVCSQSIYMDLGSGQGYASVKCVDSNYDTHKSYDPTPMFSLTFQLEFTHDNHRQRA